jgi:hypothetical protein
VPLPGSPQAVYEHRRDLPPACPSMSALIQGARTEQSLGMSLLTRRTTLSFRRNQPDEASAGGKPNASNH